MSWLRRHARLLPTTLVALLLPGGSCQYPVVEMWPDLTEFESVHQYLRVFSIHQFSIPSDPFAYSDPESLMIAIGDTLKGDNYTKYVSGTGESGTASGPYSGAAQGEPLVAYARLTDSTALVKIAGFEARTLEQFKAVLEKLVPFSNIVIDVRGNRGGELDALDTIMEAILPAGVGYIREIERVYDDLSREAYTTDLHARATSHAAHPAFSGKRLAVLVDRETASAAEILAAGLKDAASAILVGSSNTYGKAIGQIRIPRHKRPVLQITYLQLRGITPRTGDYHRTGLVPDTVPPAIRISGANESDRELYYAVKQLEPSLAPGALPKLPSYAAATAVPSCYRVLPEDILDRRQ